MSTAKLSAVGYRMAAELSDFLFEKKCTDQEKQTQIPMHCPACPLTLKSM